MNLAELINEELKKQERGVTWLSDKTGIKYKTLYDKLDRNTIKGEELLRIAKVLNIDLNKLKEEF
jgi:lambda repressor-like predicted transcriptional regulator